MKQDEPARIARVDQPGTTEWFIERLALINDSLPRTAARLFALFLIESGPFSFSELVERLQVSRGNISMSTRMLEEGGMIERIGRPGSRQDYFRVVEQPWLKIIERQMAQQRKAQGYAKTFLAMQPDLPGDAKVRIGELVATIDASLAAFSLICEPRD